MFMKWVENLKSIFKGNLGKCPYCRNGNIINDKPQELMTAEELDKYYLETTGMTYEDFKKTCKPFTDEEKKEYGLEK